MKLQVIVSAAVLSLASAAAQAQSALPATAGAACPALLNQSLPRLQDDKPQNLCQYSGKVLLVVNTASYCGFTPQYEGLEALHAIRRRPPDVILLDLMMPELDGFGLLAELQARPDLRTIPVIVLTAKLLGNDERERLQQGVVQVIEKQGLETSGLMAALLQRLP